tara:strand:+ start:21 stop:431 length:411 start_codon:yes stop_codon:yes gene_type:complete
MRTSYVFYKTDTGKIEMQRTVTQDQANNTCSSNTNMAYIEGYIDDVNANKVDISQDPPVIVSSTDNVFKMSAKQTCRELRNAYLKDCDWTVGVDSPLSDSKKAEWQTYRQQLRDFVNGLDDNLATAEGLTWPTKPS